jgi:hypothetical protein
MAVTLALVYLPPIPRSPPKLDDDVRLAENGGTGGCLPFMPFPMMSWSLNPESESALERCRDGMGRVLKERVDETVGVCGDNEAGLFGWANEGRAAIPRRVFTEGKVGMDLTDGRA